MKRAYGIWAERKLAKVICAVLICLSIVMGAAIPVCFAASPQGGKDFNVPATMPEAKPLKEYTSLELTVPADFVVYASLTTADDFKRSVTVTGTYTSEQGQMKQVLTAEEYVVSVDGSVVTDKFFDEPLKAEPETEQAADGDGERESLTKVIMVEVDCGSAEARDTVTVKNPTDIPAYSEITVDDVKEIEDDHTADTLKDLLVVKGKTAGSDVVISNKELYSVEINGSLVAGRKASITVTYLYGLSEGGNPPSVTITPTVKEATIERISVSPSKKLKLEDGIYKINLNGKDYCAFVAGMTRDEVLSRLDVTLHYQHSSKSVFDESGNVIEGMSCSVTNSSFTSNPQTTRSEIVNVTVIDNNKQISYGGSLTIRFEALQVYSIDAAYKHTSIAYKSSTPLSVSDFKVIPTYNNGDRRENEPLSETLYTVDVALTPTAADVENAMAELAAGADKAYYDKYVKVEYTKDIFCEVLFENVEYEAPKTILYIEGELVRQTIFQTFKYDGLNIYMRYDDGMRKSAPLNQLRNYCDVELLDENHARIDGDTVTRDVRFAKVTFTYPGKEPYFETFPVSVDKASYAWPNLGSSEIDFSGDCVKNIDGIDASIVNANNAANIKVTVSEKGVSGSVGAIYTAKTDTAEGKVTPVSSGSVGATFDATAGSVKFLRGGEFTVRMELTDGEDGDYWWAVGTSSASLTRTDYVLTYTITVNKGELDVRLTYKGKETTAETMEYGEFEKALANGEIGVSLRTVGSGVKVDDAINFTLWYYGFDGYTYANPTTAPSKFSVGKYRVIAVTDDTPAYVSSKTFSGFSLLLNITPKAVSADTVFGRKIYSRTGYSAEDFIDLSGCGFLPKDFVDGKPPVGITAVTPAESDGKYLHVSADGYTVRLTIKDSNYKWKDSADELNTDATFYIDKAPQSVSVEMPSEFATFEYETKAADLARPSAAHTAGSLYPFAGIADAKYYAADVSGEITGTELDINDVWSAGNYVVVFETEINTAQGDREGDYDCLPVKAAFSIYRKNLDAIVVELSETNPVYDGASHLFTLKNYRADIMEFEVSGATYAGGSIDGGMNYSPSENEVEVTYAGIYTATVSFKTGAEKNYVWNNTNDTSVQLTYELERREIVLQWDKVKFDFSENMSPAYPVPDATNSVDGNNLVLETTVYVGSSFATVIDKSELTKAGGYRIRVTALTGSRSDNYILPAVDYVDFVIGHASVAVPVLVGSAADKVETASSDTLEAVYRGAAYEFLKYVADSANYGGNVVIVRIFLGGVEADAIFGYGEYTVTVEPGENYVWDGVAESDNRNVYTYKFRVEKAEIGIDWGITQFEYDGDADGKLPSPTATKVFGCDEGKVGIDVDIVSSGNLVNGKAVNAGSYVAEAVRLSGDAKDNYKLPSLTQCGFDILKKALNGPSASANVTVTFDETDKTVMLDETAYWQSLAAIGVTSEVSMTDWLNSAAKKEGVFSVAAAEFTYTRAGIYTVSVTLDMPSNYCFKPAGASEDYESYKDVKTVTLTMTVHRKTLAAPVLVSKEGGDKPTMLLWNGSVQSPDYSCELDESIYEVLYGSVHKNGSAVEYPAGSALCASADRGEYYLQFRLKSGTINPFDYVFQKPSNADDNDGVILTRHATTVYDASGVSIYLHYAITNTVLKVEFGFGGYTFGDNLNPLLSDEFMTVRDIAVSEAGQPSDAAALATENEEGRLVMTVTFTDGDGEKSGFTYTSSDGNIVDGDGAEALENHLPWEAGEYAVTIAVSFVGNSNYETQEYSATLDVDAKEIAVTWSATENVSENGGVYEVVYDFEPHTLNASVNNAPVRNGKDSGEGITLDVALADGASLPSRVLGDEEAYTLYVVGINGEGAHNFKFGNDMQTYSSSARLKILRRTVGVVGVPVDDYIYGDSLPITKWTSADKRFETAAAAHIGARIEDASGAEIADRFTPAGTNCFVVPYKKNPADEFFNDFVVNIDKTATLTVNKREITLTVNGGISGIYGDAPIDLNAPENASRVYTVGGDGFAAGHTAADVFTLSSSVSATSDVGEYEITHSKLDENYIINFVDANKYAVNKADVKVTVTLGIIYGEDSPVNVGGKIWLGEISDLVSNSAYSFAGFKNGDETDFGDGTLADFGGSFSYTTDYVKGKAADTYEIVFDGTALTSRNYNFVDGGDGSLTVSKLALAVKVKNTSAVYNAAANTLKVEYDVKLPVSTYDNGATVVVPDAVGSDYKAIFALTTDAFTPYNMNTTTNKVGKHPIYCDFEGTMGENYTKTLTDASGNENPQFEITPATLSDVASVNDREIFYNEDWQDVIVPTRGGIEVSIYATAVDGCKVDTYFRIREDGDAELNDFDFIANGTKDMPVVRDAGEYTVYWLITAENHFEIRGSVTVKVKQANNTFEFDGGFMFANKSDKNVTDGFASTGTLKRKDGGYAWVYGVGDADHRDGYFADGGQNAAMPSTQFILGAGEIEVKIYYYATADTADATAVLLGVGYDINAVIKSIFETEDKNFKAGYYRAEFFRKGNDNFTDAVTSRIFSVAKKPLSVTPDGQTIVYGEEKPQFTFEYFGFVHNGFKLETVDDAALSAAPQFDASYNAGDDAGGDYNIEIANENSCLSDNYELEFGHAELTVDKRVVTVTIENNSTYFDFSGVSEADIAAVSKLRYTTGEGDLFGDENPITLLTSALDKCEESDKTNNAGDYPIYAVWNKAAGEKNHENNYVIRFKNCKGTFDGDSIKQPSEYAAELGLNNAGVFTVERVTLHITYDFENPTYDGKERTATPIVSGGNDKIKFNTVYYEYDESGTATEMTDSKPVNVGSYAFEFIYDSTHENYISSVTRQNFRIEKTLVDVTVKNTEIVYGTLLSDVLPRGDDSFVEYAVYYKNNWLSAEESAKLIADEKARSGCFDVGNISYTSADYGVNSAADRNYRVTASGITARNYTVHYVTSDVLSVLKRDVTVTVKGIESAANDFAKGHYGDDHQANLTAMLKAHPEAFIVPLEIGGAKWNGASSDGLSALNIGLGVNAKNVGEYDITFDITDNSVANYNVTFDAASAPKYSVEQKEINGYVYGKNRAGEYAADFDVVYGETAQFKVHFDESDFEYNEDFDKLLRAGAAKGEAVASTAYLPWTSGVGSYTVTFEGGQSTLSFDNYKINYVSKRFAVVARKVTASAANKEYAPILNNYNGGSAGQTREADVKFANAENGLEDIKAVPVLGTDFTLVYYDLTDNRQLAGAPVQAGDYRVTVNLSTKNFVFDGGNTIDYRVDKKAVVMGWNPVSLSVFGDGVTAQVDDFVKDIMNIDENGFYRQYNLTSPRPPVEQIAEEYFTATDNGLTLQVYATGEYHLSVTLNRAAQRNYVFKNGEKESITVHLLLRVTADSVTLEVDINGWIYGEYDVDANYPSVTLNGGPSDSSDMIQFFYAAVTAPIPDGFDTEHCFDDGNGELAALGLNSGSFGSRRPTDAGTYVVQAYYPATGQSSFKLFAVEQAGVDAPTIEITTSQEGKNDAYTGENLYLTVEFDNDAILLDSRLSYVTVAVGARLTAFDAGEYEIVFTLRSKNYKWNDVDSLGDALLASGGVKRVWTVNKGVAQITFDRSEYTTTYGVTNFKPTATASFGANLQFLYKTVIENDTRGENEGWLSYVEGAGRYRIMATAVGTKNYDEATEYAFVTVEKAPLKATAVGSMTYGEAGGIKLDYKFTESDFVGNDTIHNAKPGVSGGVVYLIEIDGTFCELSGIDLSALAAGSYRIKLKDVGGAVAGLVSENYIVIASTGTLSVGRKSVTVRIGNAESVYGDAIGSISAPMTVTGASISADVLNVSELYLEGVESLVKLAANSYAISARGYNNGNYDVTFVSGVYTVRARQVEIGAISSDGGEVGNVKNAAVQTLLDVTDGQNKVETTDSEVWSALTYTYTGTADGSRPDAAGSYYVTVGLKNSNFALTGQTSYSFVILRRGIDAGEIKIPSAAYNGKTLEPVIDYGRYKESDFIVEYFGERNNVGVYNIVLTLADFANMRWIDSDARAVSFTFEITQSENELLSMGIEGWTYGEKENAPTATTKFGEPTDYIFTYYDKNGNALVGVPTAAGEYAVRITVPETRNYKQLVGGEYKFKIEKAVRNTPTLGIVSSGDGKNDTYTGENLRAQIVGFDSTFMEITYDGISDLKGGELWVYALNAGEYRITLALKDSDNYRWSDNVSLDGGKAVIVWNVAKKKVAVPTADTKVYVVNGKTLVYFPNGFDENVMGIEGNTTGYGGNHQVTVYLLDPDNYEWESGGTSSFVFVWQVVGGETVFAIVTSVFGGLAFAAGVCALVQFVGHKRRLKMMKEAAQSADGGDR